MTLAPAHTPSTRSGSGGSVQAADDSPRRKADGWLPSLGVLTRDELRVANQRIDASAERRGVTRARSIINQQGLIGEGPAAARSQLPVGYLAGEPLAGPPDWVGRDARKLRGDGFDTLVLWPVDLLVLERCRSASRRQQDFRGSSVASVSTSRHVDR